MWWKHPTLTSWLQMVKYYHRFTPPQVYVPSRSAMITGMYQTADGTGNMRTLSRPPGYKNPEAPGSFIQPFCRNTRLPNICGWTVITVLTMPNRITSLLLRYHVGQLFQKTLAQLGQRVLPLSVFNSVTHEAKLWERENQPLVDPGQSDSAALLSRCARSKAWIARWSYRM